MDLLISDSATVEISARVKDVLCALVIKDWQSEPYHQHQNFSERNFWDIKAVVIIVMNATGANANE